MNLKSTALHKWRRLTQVGFGIFVINSYIPVFWTKMLYNGPLRNICVPVLNCHSCPTSFFACPIGMLQHFSAMQQIPYFILGFLGLVGLTFGRAACGWLCPFGLFQDLMFKIRSVKFRIPRFFSYFKYVFLVGLVLVLPYITQTHWFSRLCPWGGIIAAIPWVTWNPENPYTEMPTVPDDMVGFWFAVKLGIIALFLVLFVITKRPFCYTSCPLGAIFSFFNKYSLFKIEVDEECTQCDRCKEKCSMNMAAYENANNPNCVECLECIACENVKPKFNFNNISLPFPTTPGPACQSACPLGTEAWRYVAFIEKGEYEKAYEAIRKPNPFPSVCARVCHHPCEDKCGAAAETGSPVAIRALKRFITDRIDPAIYKPMRIFRTDKEKPKIAVVGSGPAGLTAAHYLSLMDYKVTVFEKDPEPGGMLISGIPPYRLPREALKKEINALLDENVTAKCSTALGKDFTIDSLFEEGYRAVFLAMGAHKSLELGLENEKAEGIFRSIEFLKAFNLHEENLAKGKVGIIGGGNSALDSARVALRQKDVNSVTIFYRRTRNEMPAFKEEIEAALNEGISIEILASPKRLIEDNRRLTGLEIQKNRLGEPDESGRARPVPVPDSEEIFPLDTLIIAVGEQPDVKTIEGFGIDIGKGERLIVNKNTMETSRQGVFAGGDVVTGPYTVVDAIASGGEAACIIDRYIKGEELYQPQIPNIPQDYIAPVKTTDITPDAANRVVPPVIPSKARICNFDEVEGVISKEDAAREAGRCLRCDLNYTRHSSGNKGNHSDSSAG